MTSRISFSRTGKVIYILCDFYQNYQNITAILYHENSDSDYIIVIILNHLLIDIIITHTIQYPNQELCSKNNNIYT